jgi:uncharacterized protein (DUF305 family)
MVARGCVVLMLLAVSGGVTACRSGATASTPQSVPRSPSETPQIVQPGAPGQASKVIPAEASARAALPHTRADAKFMQGMIPHHAQALEMAALVYANSSSEEMKLLAKRIEVSQIDEIGMMKGWLKARGEALPDEHAHHAGDHALMAGMLTQPR